MGVYNPKIWDLTGPPPPPQVTSGVDNISNRREFMPETLAQLRAIPTHQLNSKATLLGYEAAFDGLLQGTYIWMNGDKSAESVPDKIWPDDYNPSLGGTWWKLTST